MFFTLSKTLGGLCRPLTITLLLLVGVLILRKRRPRLASGLLWTALIVLYTLSTRPVADLLLLPLEAPYEHPAEPESADAIVVLGGSLDLNRSTAEAIELNGAGDRFLQGLVLAEKHPDAVLLFSGGTASLFDRSKREATMLQAWAERFGVPADRIRAEIRSRNTRENAVESKQILDAEGRHSVLLVTSAFHMKRSLGCFRRIGLSPTPHAVDFRNHFGVYGVMSVVPAVEHLSNSTHAIREYVGLVAYRLKGYI